MNEFGGYSYEDQIDLIMDTFDFAKVKRTMDFLEWSWGMREEVPEEYDLRVSARRLLKEVAKAPEDHFFIATGGFWARKNDGLLTLQFVLADRCGVY